MFTVVTHRISRNSYINYSYVVLQNNSNAVIIDPGFETDFFVKFLSSHNITLKGILLTHHHQDHAFSASDLARRFDCSIFINQDEAEFYQVHYVNQQLFPRDSVFSIGGISVRTYFTPGHTYGSSCFEIGKNVFTGDTLFIEGCGICIGKGSSAREMFFSLKKLKSALSLQHVIYPGHCFISQSGVQFEDVINNNIYLNISDAEMFMKYRMRKSSASASDFI